MPQGTEIALEQILDDVAMSVAGEPTISAARELLTLCRQAGDEVDHPARDRAVTRLSGIDTAGLLRIVEFVTARFHLMNTGEQLSIARINRQRELDAPAGKARSESIAEAVAGAKAAGVSARSFADALSRVDVGPTLTAHPTEARRRTIIARQLEIAHSARKLSGPDLTRAERDALHERLRADAALLLVSDDVRARRLTVDDEARNGLYFLSHSIWKTVPRLARDVETAFRTTYGDGQPIKLNPSLLAYRSWIGGDRDGNPEVTHQTTKATLDLLRAAAVELWDRELDALAEDLSPSTRRTTILPELTEAVERDRARWLPDSTTVAQRATEPFRLRLMQMRTRLHNDPTYTSHTLTADLDLLRRALAATGAEQLARFAPLDDALVRARAFGLNLATLDIRQHSAVHEKAVAELLSIAGVTGDYLALDEPARLHILRRELSTARPLTAANPAPPLTPMTAEVLSTLDTIRTTIASEPASIRSYVISMTHGVSDILEVLLLMKERGLLQVAPAGSQTGSTPTPRTLHVVPLLETIEDLTRGPDLLRSLFAEPTYRRHLESLARQDAAESPPTTATPPALVQEVMLGYSDSNKDGGFLMSNVALHTAQEQLGDAAHKQHVSIRFFHGRGGTVGRGGGRAGRAILAAPAAARTGRLRFTEQGEVISFRYALPEIAHRHLEQILNAAIRAELPTDANKPNAARAEDPAFRDLLTRMAQVAMRRYRAFIDSPEFWPWFVAASPIAHIGSLPIASRPVARGASGEGKDGGGFQFDQLRAIPWVFSWIQMRALAPGWFGLGAAFASCSPADLDLLRRHLGETAFLSTILDNAAQEMARARLPIARRYAALGPAGDAIYREIEQEFNAARTGLLSLTGHETLLDHAPVIAASIALRNPWTDVLNLIQIELLSRYRSAPEADKPALRSAILSSINGVAAAMQSTG